MRIKSVIRIPKFIGEYFNKDIISLDEIKSFSEFLLSIDYTLLDNGQLIYYIDNKPEFINFYLEKSKLDNYYFCKYEDELDIPKSVSNETYTVELESGGKVDVLLDFDDNSNCLILNVES